MECPSCVDDNIVIAEDFSIDIKNFEEYTKCIENLKKQISKLSKECITKDEYIKQIIKSINKFSNKK